MTDKMIMNKYLTLATQLLFAATPAYATGGLICRTAGVRPIEASMGFGHRCRRSFNRPLGWRKYFAIGARFVTGACDMLYGVSHCFSTFAISQLGSLAAL